MRSFSSTNRKHSVVLDGISTSISIEDEFWSVLRSMAENRGTSIPTLIAEINEDRRNDGNGSLASALRVAALRHVIDEADIKRGVVTTDDVRRAHGLPPMRAGE